MGLGENTQDNRWIVFLFFGFLFFGCAQPTQPEVPAQVVDAEPIPAPLPQSARLIFAITDAKPEANITKVELEFEGLAVHNGSDWVDIPLNLTSIDLLQTQGVDTLLAEVQLPPGTFQQVRLKIKQVVVVADGEEQTATLPSGELKFVHTIELQEEETQVEELDFDVERSVVITGQGNILLKPVVHLSSIGNSSIEFEEEVEIEDGQQKIKRKIEIKQGKMEKEEEHEMDEEGNVNKKAEKEEDELEEEREVEIEIEDGEAKVELEINGTKMKFTLENVTLEQVWQEIEQRTGLTRQELEATSEIEIEIEEKIEDEGEDEEGIEAEVLEENDPEELEEDETEQAEAEDEGEENNNRNGNNETGSNAGLDGNSNGED